MIDKILDAAAYAVLVALAIGLIFFLADEFPLIGLYAAAAYIIGWAMHRVCVCVYVKRQPAKRVKSRKVVQNDRQGKTGSV